MRTLVIASLAGVVATKIELTNWANWGEVMDEAMLSKPVLDDEFIASHNMRNDATWTAGRNIIFEGATLKDAKSRLGTLQSLDKSKWLPFKAPETFVELPADFDWRADPRAAKCPSLKEIRDQANCGSCWAFGSVEAMTDRICIASSGKQVVHLSTQDVTSCNTGSMDEGCSGGIPSDVYDYYAKTGVVSGGNYGDLLGCWSYQLAPCAHHTKSSKYRPCGSEANTPKCKSRCTDNTKLTWKADKHFGTGYSVCEQPTTVAKCAKAMEQDIYQHGPITAQFLVHLSFLSYKSGVYKTGGIIDPMLGGHAIKIIGYGNENGVPYWLIANSWNEDWGMGGFFKIIRGSNECQIENAMINGGPVAGEPQLSSTVNVV